MVSPVIKAARRRIIFKVLDKAFKKPSKRRRRRHTTQNPRPTHIDRHQKQKSYIELMIQEQFGHPRARHPRVLTVISQEQLDFPALRGTSPRISDDSQGRFHRRPRSHHQRNHPNHQNTSRSFVVTLSDMDIVYDDRSDGNPQFEDAPSDSL
ncbi:hypothetical protein PtB15_11B537 [Puccinia triticina]|nr:hypothetical protein PtB15_11B537 [Puccinia triticina]